jgi:hypothetical protein
MCQGTRSDDSDSDDELEDLIFHAKVDLDALHRLLSERLRFA